VTGAVVHLRCFTNREKAEAAEREVKQRERLYPHWINKRRMTPEFAAQQIGLMKEIARESATSTSSRPG
jgi:hypothetical protein